MHWQAWQHTTCHCKHWIRVARCGDADEDGYGEVRRGEVQSYTARRGELWQGRQMISDEQLQAALDWLREAASKAAKARAERLYLEEWLPALRARIAQEGINAGLSAAAAEISAKSSDAYQQALEGFKAAVEADELFRWRRSSADAVLSAWQSFNANQRAMGKLQ